MDSENPIRGRCLCGAVRFALTPPTDFVAHCHCQSCRLAHGASYATWTSVPEDRFAYSQGEEEVGWYRSSEWIRWGFCKTCGSSIFYIADSEGHPEEPRTDCVYVAAGSLIDPLDRPPSGHYSYEERADWYNPHDALPHYRGKTDQTTD